MRGAARVNLGLDGFESEVCLQERAEIEDG